MTNSNTPDQRINVIVGGIIAAGIKEYNKHANLLVASDEYLVDVAKEKAALKSLFETMLDGTLYVTLPKGVDKTCMKLLIEEQKKRSKKVISKYFGGGE